MSGGKPLVVFGNAFDVDVPSLKDCGVGREKRKSDFGEGERARRMGSLDIRSGGRKTGRAGAKSVREASGYLARSSRAGNKSAGEEEKGEPSLAQSSQSSTGKKPRLVSMRLMMRESFLIMSERKGGACETERQHSCGTSAIR
jgi:hypothetical protein